MKKRKKKKLKLKNFLLALFLLSIFILITYSLLNVPVRGFYIKGNKYYSDDEILSMTNLSSHPSFLFTNSLTVSRKVRKNKVIKNIKIKKTLFLEFIVIVNEKKMLYVNNENKKVVLEDGEEIEENNINLPVMINKIEDKKVYDKFLLKMQKINSNTLNIISEIKYEPNYIDKERFLLSINDGNYVYLTLSKFQSINNYARISKTLGEKNGILYLDYGNYFLSQ